MQIQWSLVTNQVSYTLLFAVRDEITALVDDLVINTKKLVRATTKEIEKWRR